GNVELLRWRRRQQGLLLAPMKARGGDEDPVYRYLRFMAADEEDAELGRLLYVGCTRARQRLHLTAVLGCVQRTNGELQWKSPPSGSALAKLWPALADMIAPPAIPATHSAADSPAM